MSQPACLPDDQEQGPAGPVYVRRIRVPPGAIDLNGHTNNLEYLRWMQEIALAHSAARGWTLARYRSLGATWVVRSHHIEYLRPTHAGDELLLLTWVEALGRRQSPRGYCFVRSHDLKPVVRARTQWVFVDAASGRPREIPSIFHEDLQTVPDEATALTHIRLQD